MTGTGCITMWRATRDGKLKALWQHILEFGVSRCQSLRRIANAAVPENVYGFDWWQGLPEALCGLDFEGNYHEACGKGQWAGRPVDLPPNVILVDGLFDQSLPNWLADHSGPISFVHIDCDLYSSTKCVLTLIAPNLMDGALLCFDELIDYGGNVWQDHEYKAFNEFLADTGYRAICIAKAGPAAAFEITR